MAEVKATVTAVDGDYALIRVTGQGCGRCHEPGGCCGSSLAQVFQSSSRRYLVLNPRRAKPDEEVVVVIDDGIVFRSAVLGYGGPLLGLFLGAIAGLVFVGETGSMLGAAAGLSLAWGIHKTGLMRKTFSAEESQPYIR